MSTPKLVQSFLQNATQNPELQIIMFNIEKIKTVSKLFNELLEPTLASQCQVANYKNGCITLQASNAAIVTRLRYEIPDILEKLRKPEYLPGLASIKCIVRPEETNKIEKILER